MSMLDLAKGAVKRFDGFVNDVLGIGGIKDPRTATRWIGQASTQMAVLQGLWRHDHFAAKIIEALPREAMRPGWSLASSGPPQEAAMLRTAHRNREDELRVRAHMLRGAFLGRVFGGALTWIGADDGLSPESPLDIEAIRTVRWLRTFDAGRCYVEAYDTDPRSPTFGEPKVFRILPRDGSATVYLHASRCVTWPGAPVSDDTRVSNGGWDDSVLERCMEALQDASENYGSMRGLMGRISQPVYMINELLEMLAGGQKDILRQRVELMERNRSRANALLLDNGKAGGEDARNPEGFVNVAQPTTGVSEMIDRTVLRLAAAADMPATVLMGQSPAGMDATGESDLELWQAQAESWREHTLRERHERITLIMLRARDFATRGIEPDGWSISYEPLRVQTDSERETARKLTAERDKLYVEMGAVYAEDIAYARFSPHGWSAETTLDLAFLEAARKRRQDLANQPPKDNAELGTVGARDSAIQSLQDAYYSGKIPEEAALARLEHIFRLPPEVARTFIAKPAGWEMAKDEPASSSTPGPAPDPQVGGGAGAPQGLPGFTAGGSPKDKAP